MFRRDQWLHPATILAAMALFVSMGGVGYAASQIGTKQLKNRAVTTKKLALNAVTSDRLRDGSVGAADLAPGAVGAGAIGDAVVTGPKLAPGSVGQDALAGGAVGTDRIADGAVSSAKIADGAVTGAKIADGSVGRSDLDLASVADVRSYAATTPNDNVSRDLMVIDGFGTLRGSCSNTAVNVFYALNSPVPQRAHLFGHDPTDNSPVGAVGITGTAGGIGYGGTAFLSDVSVWSSTDERVVFFEVRVTAGSVCAFRVRATIDRNDA